MFCWLAHSGAGPLAPAIAADCGRVIAASVFVDAGLPDPGTTMTLAPSALHLRLAYLAVGGVLPRWSRWWPADVMKRVLPDAAYRERLAVDKLSPASRLRQRTQYRLRQLVRSEACGAYRRVSTGYEDGAPRAETRGCPTETDRLATGHLHVRAHPEDVTQLILQLLSTMGMQTVTR